MLWHCWIALLLLLSTQVLWRSARLVDWLRAAWLLRSLPRPTGNSVFGGVQRLMTGKRLRMMQRLNTKVVEGSGVFYYNILWGHVRTPSRQYGPLLHLLWLRRSPRSILKGQ